MGIENEKYMENTWSFMYFQVSCCGSLRIGINKQTPHFPSISRKYGVYTGSGGGIRTPDTRIMIPLL